MDFGRFHGRNIILINSSLSLSSRTILAGTVTDTAAESVYETVVSVTFGDYSGQTVNLSPCPSPEPGKFGGCRAAVVLAAAATDRCPPQATVAQRDVAPSHGRPGRPDRSQGTASCACCRTGTGNASTSRLAAARADTDLRRRKSSADIEPARRCADARAAIPDRLLGSGALAKSGRCRRAEAKMNSPAPRPTNP